MNEGYKYSKRKENIEGGDWNGWTGPSLPKGNLGVSGKRRDTLKHSKVLN